MTHDVPVDDTEEFRPPVEQARPRRLLLLRHAKAESPGALADELRPLSLDGRRQCADVAGRLRAADLVPEHVIVSSAVRTRQTWELVRAGLGDDCPEPSVDVTERAYDATMGDLLTLAQEAPPEARTVLLVVHEPAVSAVASFVAGDDGVREHLDVVRRGLGTGVVAVLETTSAWVDLGPGRARLVDLLRPAVG